MKVFTPKIFLEYYSCALFSVKHSLEPLYVAIDGKLLPGNFDHFEDRKAAHLLSAFCFDEQIILGHLETDEIRPEIPAVPCLIDELGFKIVCLH